MRTKATSRIDSVIEVRGNLKMWGASLAAMTEQMRHAPFMDHDAAPEARMSGAMEVYET